MKPLRELVELAKPLITRDGFTETRISRVQLFRSSRPIPRQPILYDAWIVANLQGRKTLYYADRTLQYDTESILCTTSGSPVECEAEATTAKPLIAVVLDLRMDELMGMAARMNAPRRSDSRPPRVVDVFPLTPQLQEVYGRLLRALHDPNDASILGESLVTEVVYRVLQHGLADSLASLASNRNSMAILHALRILHESYATPITIEKLASSVAMSESAFHLHFRKITSDSPLQYLKGIRLNKARQSIQTGGTTLTEVAQAVGYESASQFSGFPGVAERVHQIENAGHLREVLFVNRPVDASSVGDERHAWSIDHSLLPGDLLQLMAEVLSALAAGDDLARDQLGSKLIPARRNRINVFITFR